MLSWVFFLQPELPQGTLWIMKNFSLIGVLILLYVIFPLPVLQDQDLSTYKYLSEENDLVTVPLRRLLFSVGL